MCWGGGQICQKSTGRFVLFPTFIALWNQKKASTKLKPSSIREKKTGSESFKAKNVIKKIWCKVLAPDCWFEQCRNWAPLYYLNFKWKTWKSSEKWREPGSSLFPQSLAIGGTRCKTCFWSFKKCLWEGKKTPIHSQQKPKPQRE